MLARTNDTYRKLNKIFTGTIEEVKDIINRFNCIPMKDIVICTRGDNDIAYYRPMEGKYINDKVWMIHYNKDHTFTLYM